MVYIREALRLILNAANTKISPYGTRDRSKDVTIMFSFTILPLLSSSLCRDVFPFKPTNCICISLPPLKNAHRNTLIHKEMHL